METEIWRPIRFYEDRYEVSNLGNIRSLKTQKVLKPSLRNKKHYVTLMGNGYNKIMLRHGGIGTRLKVTNFEIGFLVAFNFKNSARVNEKRVRHADGNLLNNSLTNLTWTDEIGS